MRFFVLVLLFIQLLPIYGKQTVCLNMIVKNESRVIRRSLDTLKPLIDYWVIVDTGSTDGTQEVIKEHMKDIPGELFERPWKNFGYNRTEALDLAKDKADYILFMDADDWLEYEEGYQFPELTKGAYKLKFTYPSRSCEYLKSHLIKASFPWKWEGVMHEYVTCEKPHTYEVLAGVEYIIGSDGARSQDPQKYIKAAKVLEII